MIANVDQADNFKSKTMKSITYIKYITYGCLFQTLFDFNLLAQEKAPPIGDNLLIPPKIGESRPAWWYDLWYGNGIAVSGEIIKIDNIGLSDTIESVNLKDNSIVKLGLKKASILISEVLQIKNGEKEANSNYFKKDGIVDVYIVSKYDKHSNSWLMEKDIEKNHSTVFLFSEIGLAKPGLYYIKWNLDGELKKTIKSIIENRKKFTEPDK